MMSWRPNASFEVLKARAELNSSVRAFFSARGVMEVETPLLSAHATVDRHIESFPVPPAYWLHTSPEFAMKRLVAAGSGPIYQIAKVFRWEEQGRHHNPEFTLLEWYRPGWDHVQLMDEVEALLRHVGIAPAAPFEHLSYRQAFLLHAGFDPIKASFEKLREGLAAHRIPVPDNLTEEENQRRDFWLDVWMSHVIGPKLGERAPCFLTDFPASQAALARVKEGVAQRFELIWKGLELANGFHELAEAAEQQRRFEADQVWRREQGKTVPPYDKNLIAALEAGFPDCAGVALGLDRLLMLIKKLPDISSSLAFDISRS